MLELSTRIQYVKGVGPRKAEALNGAGIVTVSDLLMVLPFRYEDWSRRRQVAELQPGEEATVFVTVLKVRVRKTRRPGFTVLEVLTGDATGKLKAVWFNQEFLKDTFQIGRRLQLFGRVERSRYGGTLEMKTPQYEASEDEAACTAHSGRLVPVYQRIGPVSPRMIRRITRFLIDGIDFDVPELLPEALRHRYQLPSRREAIALVHFPEDGASLELYNRFRSPAHRRLIFEELFLFFVGVGLRRRAADELAKPRVFPVNDRIREIVRKIMPFRLTEAQRRVLKTLAEELSSPRPMHRLLQGDVGSGKTIVAVLASVIVMENAAQVAFMVPTELLAEQHTASIRPILERAGYQVALLRSGLPRAEREEQLGRIARGEIDLVIGTHALIQNEVSFKELGLVVIDEQHRFGVVQRAELRRKGHCPDLLVMTATPIPRSLAMTLYGDLDCSVLDELPPGRRPIRTILKDGAELDEVYDRMRRELEGGHQIYYVCPLIEESEKVDLEAAVARYEALRRGPFSDVKVALVHGRLSSQERESVMASFADGRVGILVATTVVEVGLDVANATMMIIEHAERFGLAQLHQLRGRVGRGAAPSTAVLLYHPPLTAEAKGRLGAMKETNDGFLIAERDLEIRGPGDSFGTRQSGVPLFRVADMIRDAEVRDLARREAEDLLASAAPETPEMTRLVRHVNLIWGTRFGLASAG